MSVDIRTRQQLWKDISGNLVEKDAELANTYDMPLSEPTQKPGTSDESAKPKKGAMTKTAEPTNPLDAAMQFRKAMGEAAAFHGGQEDISPEMQAAVRNLVTQRAAEEAGGARSMADYAESHPVQSRSQKILSGALMGAGAGTGAGAYLKGTPAALGLGALGGAALGGLGGFAAGTTPGEHAAKAQRLESAAAGLDPAILDELIEQQGRLGAGLPRFKEKKEAPAPREPSPPPPAPAPPMMGPQGLDIRIAVPLLAAAQQAQMMNQKTAEAEGTEDVLKEAFLVGVNHGDVKPDDNEGSPTKGEMPKSLPQAKAMKPTVDVSRIDPPKQVTVKKAEFYAVPSEERYPLDGYDQVKRASVYFDEWRREMPLPMRREYCQNMVKRASALGISVSEEAARYGSEKFASQHHIDICLDARRSVLGEDETKLEVLNKLAAIRQRLSPDVFATCLMQFDKMAGLDQHYDTDVPDPYLSTFEKSAAAKTESDPAPEDSIIIGSEYVTKRKLFEFSKRGSKDLCTRFGEDFAGEFAKDPMAIFDSLPRDQKLVLMRMANSSGSNRGGASVS